MTDHTKSPATAAALLGLALTAPLSPHGHCFGLIPAGGDWLDDLIDWSRRQFKRPEDAQRIVASWNALVHVPLAQLLEPRVPQSEMAKLRAALTDCKGAVRPAAVPVDLSMHFVTSSSDLTHAEATQTRAEPTGFSGAVVALNAALRALKTELAGEFHEYANEQDEELQAPVQFAAQKIADAMLLLYGVGVDAAPRAVMVREPYARRATRAACEHEWPAGEGGTDLDGACTKCGMAFQHMIHMEMP
jgi:hypothetical protein